MIWGETEKNDQYIITKDGYLFLQNIGQVFVNGLTLEQLEQKLYKLFKKVYSTLDKSSDNAKTFLDISLGSTSLRPIRIFVLGEVAQPGAYNVSASTTLFNSLFYFNGPKISGSLRDIKLIRNNNEIAKIDFYDYLITGKQVNDVRLQRDDVVFIPTRGKSVTVSGEINRPAIYELKIEEGLNDLIRIAGGLAITTYMKRVQIDRIIPPDQRTEFGMDRTLIDVELEEIIAKSENFELYDGDQVQFFRIGDIRHCFHSPHIVINLYNVSRLDF